MHLRPFLLCSGVALLILVSVLFASSACADAFCFALFSLTADWFFEGDGDGDQVGYAVATAGDVNGDGYADVVIGAPRDRLNAEPSGAAYLFYGSEGGLADSPDWTAEDGQKGSLFGASISSAGDVDGDGFDDLIVGAPGYKTDVTYGAAFVYFGSTYPDTTADWSYVGQQKDAAFGVAVSAAGDVNGDGYDDVIVGAQHYSDTLTNEGAAFVFRGSVTGLESTPAWLFVCGEAGASCGASVATAGDINGDGYPDVVVGAPNYGADNQGAVFVFYGSDTGLSSLPDWSFVADESGAKFGISASTAGDVDGDGVSELIVGAPYYGEDDEGALFLFYGTRDLGLVETPRIFMGEQANAQFGAAVGAAGDANGDGYADVIVGAPFFGEEGVEDEQKDEGASWVFYGSPLGLLQSQSQRAEGDKAETEFGAAVDTAGDLDGDGYADLIVGAPRYKRDQKEAHGAAFVYLGSEMPEIVIRSVFLPLVLRSPP